MPICLLSFLKGEVAGNIVGCKSIVFTFHPVKPKETIYGRREGALTGLAVLHRDKANTFRGTAGFKGAVIRDVKMLPRNAMWKPPVFWLF